MVCRMSLDECFVNCIDRLANISCVLREKDLELGDVNCMIEILESSQNDNKHDAIAKDIKQGLVDANKMKYRLCLDIDSLNKDYMEEFKQLLVYLENLSEHLIRYNMNTVTNKEAEIRQYLSKLTLDNAPKKAIDHNRFLYESYFSLIDTVYYYLTRKAFNEIEFDNKKKKA